MTEEPGVLQSMGSQRVGHGLAIEQQKQKCLSYQTGQGGRGRGWFFHGSVVKNSPSSAGDLDLIPGLGPSPGGGQGNPLRYSCLENSMERGAWWATVHRDAQSRT